VAKFVRRLNYCHDNCLSSFKGCRISKHSREAVGLRVTIVWVERTRLLHLSRISRNRLSSLGQIRRAFRMELTKEVNYGVMQASQIIQAWPEESKEAAQLVIKQYGEPDKMTETRLTGHEPGPMETDRHLKDVLSTQFPGAAYRFR
jgi:hypothetical protein